LLEEPEKELREKKTEVEDVQLPFEIAPDDITTLPTTGYSTQQNQRRVKSHS